MKKIVVIIMAAIFSLVGCDTSTENDDVNVLNEEKVELQEFIASISAMNQSSDEIKKYEQGLIDEGFVISEYSGSYFKSVGETEIEIGNLSEMTMSEMVGSHYYSTYTQIGLFYSSSVVDAEEGYVYINVLIGSDSRVVVSKIDEDKETVMSFNLLFSDDELILIEEGESSEDVLAFYEEYKNLAAEQFEETFIVLDSIIN